MPQDYACRQRQHGAAPLGDVLNYNEVFRLCYIRGPGGLLMGLAQELT